ncbi:MAG: hypothetical protein VB111_03080 [Clostridiaceae bacterium]|nr:hypothetical protein [Clostridiaceae bacterium]
MRITAIFETTDLAENAASAIAQQIPLQERRVISLEGTQDVVAPYTHQPAIIAPGYENLAVTNGTAFAQYGGAFPFGVPFPLPWTSVTAEQAQNEASREARLELDVNPADAAEAEKLLVNLHGRAITSF